MHFKFKLLFPLLNHLYDAGKEHGRAGHGKVKRRTAILKQATHLQN
jgi:hypothetical protein